MKRISAIAFVPLLLVAFASATTIVPRTVEELTAEASNVVEGKAVATWTSWDSNHLVLLTYTRFAVTKTLKGAATKEMVVQQLGGSDGVLTQKVAGVRQFQVGENTLLFLRPGDSPTDAMVVVGLMQGNFQLVTDSTGKTMASNGVPDTFVLRGSQVGSYSGTHMKLSDLESRIQKAVQQ